MGTVIGVLGLLGFGIVMIVIAGLIATMALRTLRLEILPRMVETRPGPIDAALSLFGAIGSQLVVLAFALITGVRSIQIALQALGM